MEKNNLFKILSSVTTCIYLLSAFPNNSYALYPCYNSSNDSISENDSMIEKCQNKEFWLNPLINECITKKQQQERSKTQTKYKEKKPKPLKTRSESPKKLKKDKAKAILNYDLLPQIKSEFIKNVQNKQMLTILKNSITSHINPNEYEHFKFLALKEKDQHYKFQLTYLIHKQLKCLQDLTFGSSDAITDTDVNNVMYIFFSLFNQPFSESHSTEIEYKKSIARVFKICYIILKTEILNDEYKDFINKLYSEENNESYAQFIKKIINKESTFGKPGILKVIYMIFSCRLALYFIENTDIEDEDTYMEDEDTDLFELFIEDLSQVDVSSKNINYFILNFNNRVDEIEIFLVDEKKIFSIDAEKISNYQTN